MRLGTAMLLGCAALILLALAALVRMGGFAAPEGGSSVTRSAPEVSQAEAMILGRSRLVESRPWRRTRKGDDRVRLERQVRFRAEDGDRPLEIVETAEVIGDNEAAQRQRYDELAQAVRSGRARKMENLPAIGLATLDIGRNVASVAFIGDERLAMECEIIGFRMPSMIGRCRWLSQGSCFMVETDPRLLRHVLEKRAALEDSLLLAGANQDAPTRLSLYGLHGVGVVFGMTRDGH